MLPTWTMIQFIEKVEDVENILGIIRGRLYETNEKTLQVNFQFLDYFKIIKWFLFLY